MLALALILILFLLAFAVLSQKIDLRVYASSDIILQFSSVLWSFKIKVWPNDHKKSKLKFTSRLKLYLFIVKIIRDMLPKASVSVSADSAHATSVPALPNALSTIVSSFLFTSYVSGRARVFESDIDGSDNSLTVFSFSLITLFISTFKVSYYILKSKIKKRIKHG